MKPWIIEEKKRKDRRNRHSQLQIQLPVPGRDDRRQPDQDSDKPQRGVIIINPDEDDVSDGWFQM